jgi:hypothetical protein
VFMANESNVISTGRAECDKPCLPLEESSDK